MDAWSAWRTRLSELRQAIDDHLGAAEAMAEGPARAPTRAPARRRCRRGPATPSAAVQRALDHAAEHFDQPLSLGQLARIAGCSREHLARACRRETGATVHAHLVRLRLTRAAREVRAGDKIEAVMLGVGYRGKRNFYRQFKARFGMTPGRYRESNTARQEADDGG